MDLPAYTQMSSRLWVSHILGDGNPLADAASRGYFDLLRELAQQLNIRLVRLSVPQQMHTLLDDLLHQVTEHGLLRVPTGSHMRPSP